MRKVKNDGISEKDVEKTCSDPVFMEAIYLASPYLHGEIEEWMKSGDKLSPKKQEKLTQTILKYYNRKYYRVL